jgi:hypothetical protein
VDVLIPLAARATAAKRLAPRPSSLRGLRVGILDNGKPNADALLGRVAELLAERAGTGPARWWRKPAAAYAAAALDAIAAASDVVLTGSAD